MVSEIDFLIGLSFVLGFAVLLTLMSKVNFFKGFISYCLIASVFVYKAGYLELWFIVLFLFLDLVVLFSQIKNRGVSKE